MIVVALYEEKDRKTVREKRIKINKYPPVLLFRVFYYPFVPAGLLSSFAKRAYDDATFVFYPVTRLI